MSREKKRCGIRNLREFSGEKIFSQDLSVRCQRNLSKEEQKALDNLRGYDDIIIKQTDKGYGQGKVCW